MTTGRARNYIALQCIGYVVDHWLWAMVVMLWIIGYGPWSLCGGSLAIGHDRYVYDILHRVILLISWWHLYLVKRLFMNWLFLLQWIVLRYISYLILFSCFHGNIYDILILLPMDIFLIFMIPYWAIWAHSFPFDNSPGQDYN